jgi:Putative DNA-binding domain
MKPCRRRHETAGRAQEAAGLHHTGLQYSEVDRHMGVFQKPLVQVNESDLLGLFGESENKTLDYKRDLPGQREGEKKEFLYDASSFANTLGGDIVFGVEEQNGMAINLVGLAGINPDNEILRLQEILRDGIRPPITGVDPKVIKLTNGNVAIVVRIPKSWNPPHQVTFQKAFRFYARDSNGKYQVDVDELRSIFSLSGMIAERIRAFRVERVAKITAGDTPVPLHSGGNFVLHLRRRNLVSAPRSGAPTQQISDSVRSKNTRASDYI